MRKPHLLLASPLSPGEDVLLEQDHVVHRLWELADGAIPSAAAAEIRAIATSGSVGADAALMGRLPHLEIVACYGVGFDRVDLDHARAHGIRVTNTPDVLTDDVADMGMALLLAVARRIPAGDRWVRSGRWSAGPMPLTTGLAGKRLGILGLGRIGRAVARRVEAFGMQVLYSGRHPHDDVAFEWRATPLDLARDVDALIVCAAGGEETRHLVDANVLEALGPQGFLVNVARGSLIDEPALIAALREGRIAGAGLDVYEGEPGIDRAFADLETVVLQPHAGSGTRETRAAIGGLMRANLAAHFAGEPLPTPVL